MIPSAAVTALAEVVSPASVHRDYGVKRSIHAASGVPAYLIIDPIMARCVLLTEPSGEGAEADFQVQLSAKFGCRVPPAPLGSELDTRAFGTYKGVSPHRCP